MTAPAMNDTQINKIGQIAINVHDTTRAVEFTTLHRSRRLKQAKLSVSIGYRERVR